MKFKAVIFDMDGVLIDSEVYWFDAEREFFRARGLEFTKDLQLHMQGRSESETAVWLKKEFGWSDTPEEIEEQRRKMSESVYTDKCHPLPGVFDVIKVIKTGGLKTAVVSSSSLQRINIIIGRFGWEGYFDHIISAEEKKTPGKPAPDIYIYASNVLETKPTNCLVFEDSLNGVKSAKSAGMYCVGVADPRWSNFNLGDADLIISSFQDKKVLEFLNI